MLASSKVIGFVPTQDPTSDLYRVNSHLGLGWNNTGTTQGPRHKSPSRQDPELSALAARRGREHAWVPPRHFFGYSGNPWGWSLHIERGRVGSMSSIKRDVKKKAPPRPEEILSRDPAHTVRDP